MIEKLTTEIPSRSITYITISSGIIILIVLIVVVPFYRYNLNLTQEVKNIQTSIDDQKGLKQAYQLLISASQRKENSGMLPNPVKIKLPREAADKFQKVFRNEAGKAGFMTLSMVPDIKVLAGGSPNLLYDVTLRGQFGNFRKLLIGLGSHSVC